MAVSNIKALIPGELQKVWELVLNTENYAAWRSDLSKNRSDKRQAIYRIYQKRLPYDLYRDAC